MASYYYPSVIALLDGLIHEMDPTEISKKFVLRNPKNDEIDSINSFLDRTKLNHLPKLCSDRCLLEINGGIPSDKNYEEYKQNVNVHADKLAKRALTFLRLYQPGNLGIAYVWVPLAQMDNYAFTILNTPDLRIPQPRRIPQSQVMNWLYYIEKQQYVMTKDYSELENLVVQFWDEKIDEEGFVRWFNKSFIEWELDDKLTDLIFALEQIYLRKESERGYISYKLAIRCASLLAEDLQEKKDIYDNIREGYKIRNKVVHSGKRLESTQETMDLMISLEEYLRKSIRKYLKDESFFCSEKLDNLVLGLMKFD